MTTTLTPSAAKPHQGLRLTRPGVAAERPPSPGRRLLGGLRRRARLYLARALHPSVRFGGACDVRPRLEIRVARGGTVDFARGCVLDKGMTVECGPGAAISVGARTIFGHHCTIAARDRVEIGPDCLIAELVSVRDHDHCFDRLNVPVREQGAVSAPVRIGRNVWLAGKVTVLRGVTIGDNAIVGANAVVTRDIPANAIAVGVPARVIRYR